MILSGGLDTKEKVHVWINPGPRISLTAKGKALETTK